MILDTLPIFKWRTLGAALKAEVPSDRSLARQCLGHEDFMDAQSFSHLRSAVAFLFKHESLKARRVLLPSYTCPSVAEAIHSQGYKVTFIDLEELHHINLKNVGAVLVVHAFGIPVQMDSIASLCKKNGILLVEDCAHSAVPAEVGKWGDYVLFHFAKRQAALNGGLLISRNKPLAAVEETAKFPLKAFLRLFLQTQILRPLVNVLRARTPLYEDKGAYFDFSTFKAAHPLAKRLAQASWKEKLKGQEKRRELRELYLSELGKDFTPLCREAGVDTLHFPVSVPFGVDRDALLLKLRRSGIFADRLWYNCDDALARKILSLPIHEGMSRGDVQKIVGSLTLG